MFKSWFERTKLLMKPKRRELGLLDDIKTNFYSYGYSTYTIQEKKLDKEYEYLLENHLVSLEENATTEKMTSICPTKKGMKVGLTTQEKNQQKQRIWKLFKSIISFGLLIVSGLVIALLASILGWNK